MQDTTCSFSETQTEKRVFEWRVYGWGEGRRDKDRQIENERENDKGGLERVT